MSERKRNTKGLVPFPKGVSGNPNGVKKGTKQITPLLRKLVASEFTKEQTDIISGEKRRMTGGEMLAASLFAKALKGNIPAAKEVLNRLEGLPTQEIKANVSGDPDNPEIRKVQIEFIESRKLEKDGGGTELKGKNT